MNTIAVPWGVEVGLISWRSVRNEGRPPLPSELLATFVAFGAFAIVTVRAPKVGNTLAWGIVIATYFNMVDPASKNPFAVKAPSFGNTKPKEQKA